MTAQSNYERIVKYRIKKAKAKLCQWAGCKESAYYMCPKHLAKAGEYNKRAYEKRKLNENRT